MKILNPATNALLREVNEDTADSVRQKTTEARAAQDSWSRKPLEFRLGCIETFKQKVIHESDRLARVLTDETGKPISQARNELKAVIGRIDFFLQNTARVLETEVVLADPRHSLTESISWEPLGVIANISAWNYPWFVGTNVFVPALLCGNAVIYKPSEFATLTGIEIGRLMHESGVPPAVFSVVVGGGEVGAAILAEPIDGVYFTGSAATGRRIAETVAGRMIRVQMELGGKDPVYVAEDVADGVGIAGVAEAVADGAFYNNGQSCCSVERIYVHEKIFEPFVTAFTHCVKAFVSGDPLDENTYLSVLARPQQVVVLEEQIADALKKGARLLLGGKRSTGTIEPTILVDVNSSMTVMREESFGPLIGIQKVSGDDEALRLMNDTTYGLTASVYSKSRERARAILSRVNAGTAYWNCCDRVSARLPWSGRGQSGVGVTLSTQGILSFVQTKAWHERAIHGETR